MNIHMLQTLLNDVYSNTDSESTSSSTDEMGSNITNESLPSRLLTYPVNESSLTLVTLNNVYFLVYWGPCSCTIIWICCWYMLLNILHSSSKAYILLFVVWYYSLSLIFRELESLLYKGCLSLFFWWIRNRAFITTLETWTTPFWRLFIGFQS